MEILESAVDAIGHTPLIRLSRVHPPGNLVAKVEFMSVGGSVKDRIASEMIQRAEEMGELRRGGTIVEPTSGNTGVGLAIVGALRGYRVICTVPDKVSEEKKALLRAYGVEVIVTPTELGPEHPDSYYGVARKITEETPGAFSPNQYANQANPASHYHTTGPEIWEQTDGNVGALVVGVGTGGTITGAGRYLKEQNPEVLVVGVDPKGSIYTAESDDDIHQYHVEGVGEDFWPETFDRRIVDEWVMVEDGPALEMTRRLARTEALLVGPSCGLAAVGALQTAIEYPTRLVVVILPDSGRGYLSKVYNDAWMAEQGFAP